jgi:putative FmdB family regulatory protein
MPLYEYECTTCHKHTEKIQKFSDPEITICPHCGGPLERVISAPAISFKGGGWYADGYGNAKPAASGDSKAAPSSDAKPSSGSESSAPAAVPAAAAAPSAPAASSSSSDKK